MNGRWGIRENAQTTKSSKNEVTLLSALDDFYLDLRARHLAQGTLKYYTKKLGQFAQYCEAQRITTLASLKTATIKRYFLDISDRGCSTMTVNVHARAVRAFLNYCVHDELIAESPFVRMKLPSIDRETKDALADADIKAVLHAADNLRDYALVLFMLDTGVRSSELRAIEIADLDQQDRSVVLRHTKARKQRTCYLSAKTLKAIRRYLATRKEAKPHAPLFAARLRGALTEPGLIHIMQRLTRLSGVKITAHALRRTCAITMLRNGASIYHVQRQLGHKGIDVLKWYLPLVDDDLRDAHAKYSPVDNL